MGKKEEISTIKNNSWPSGIDSIKNSEYAQRNGKVTQKKKNKNRNTGFQNFIHTPKHEDILKRNNQE